MVLRQTMFPGDYKDVEYVWQDPAILQRNERAQQKLSCYYPSGLTVQETVETAWASASTFRGSDNRGGANGARIALEPQRSWEMNKPEQLNKVLDVYSSIASEHDVSLADVIVLGGAVGIERASTVKVPATTGRGDATQENTDIDSFNLLAHNADGFRNYIEKEFAVSPEELMLDKAQLLGLTPVEMTVLYGGLRALETGKLDNTWFKTLLSMAVKWKPHLANNYVAKDRCTGEVIRTAPRTDLVFGSNPNYVLLLKFMRRMTTTASLFVIL